MLKPCGNDKSGNIYRATLALHPLGKPCEEVHIGLESGTEPEYSKFLAIDPLEQMPIRETEDGRFISQSNAIL